MDDYDEARKAYVEVYTGLKRQQQALKEKESGLLIDGRNRLTFAEAGNEKAHIFYVSPTGKKYQQTFTRNAFLLLHHLVHNHNQVFTSTDFMFRKKRGGDKDMDLEKADERRVRDTIQHIRNKLGLSKNKSEDFFIVEGKRFGIRCAVEIKDKS